MNRSNRPFGYLLLAALLAMAVALIWPSMGLSPDSSPFGPPDHATAAHPGATPHGHADPLRECGQSVPGCCAMTLCHPGVPHPGCEVALVGLPTEHPRSLAARVAGSDPGIVLPPPRFLPA